MINSDHIFFFDHAKELKRRAFDSEVFSEYLAYHDRQLKNEVTSLGFYFEGFLNPEDIKKSSRFSAGVEGFSGKMILKSGKTVIRIYAKIDESGNPFVKIGINDSVRKFFDKESLVSGLTDFEKRIRRQGEFRAGSSKFNFSGKMA